MLLSQITHSLLFSLFVAAPVSVVPLLDRSSRLDLVDLYEAGMVAQAGNKLGGISVMTQANDTMLCIKMTEASTMEILLNPDSMVVVRHIVKLPEEEHTTTHVYDQNWNKINNK